MSGLGNRGLLITMVVCVGTISAAIWAQAPGRQGGAPAQPPVAPISEEYLLMGDATRGAGEAKIAVDPTNSKNIVAISMGNLHMLPGFQAPIAADMTNKYHEVDRSTIAWLAVTHDGGVTWKVGELPILTGKHTRCPDPFVGVTKQGVFLAGCEPRETTGEFLGGSAVMISNDKGDTWGKPAEIISSYTPERFAPGLKPRIGGNSPWDGPDIYIDDQTGTIYAKATGGQTDIDTGKPGVYRGQSYVTASTDGGKSFGTIYSWDSKEYPQSGGGGMAAGHGIVAVMYQTRSVPASEQAACPCQVLGISKDQGKTFSYHVMKHITFPPPTGMAGPGGAGGSGVSDLKIDPTKAGRFAILKYSSRPRVQYEVSVSEDYGNTWGPFVLAGTTPEATSFTKPRLEFSRDGVLGLVWRAYYADGTLDFWSAISRDGGHSFSAPLRVSHLRSPAPDFYRNTGRFGDDYDGIAMSKENIYMVWAENRSGFQGVWFGRVPLSAYQFPAH